MSIWHHIHVKIVKYDLKWLFLHVVLVQNKCMHEWRPITGTQKDILHTKATLLNTSCIEIYPVILAKALGDI